MYLIKHHVMKTYGGIEVQLHAFLTSAVDEVELSSSRLADLPPDKEPPVLIE
jgi:hypothetical protein